MKKCAFIYNPESGKKNNKKDINSLVNLLNKNDYEVILYPTEYAGHATDIVSKLKKIDLIISCGGDGTLNEVIKGNLKRKNKILMGHLPTGTTNDVGAMYGYTKNILTNLQLLISGTIKNIDTCLINNKPFVYVACIGNYVDVAYNTPRDLKKKYGRFGYFINAINELKTDIKNYEIEYYINGEKKEGIFSYIFVSNTSQIGGFKNIYDDVKLDDNKFEVILVNKMKKSQLAITLTSVLTNNIKKVQGIEYYKTDNFKVVFKHTPSESWCLDGEELKHKNKTFEFTINKDINMLLPKKNIIKLFKNLEEVK